MSPAVADNPLIAYYTDRVPTIERFFQSNKRMRVLMGPFGSGKSSGCVWEIIRRGKQQRPGPSGIRRTKWAVIRNTYRELEDTTIRTVLNWLPEHLFGTYKSADREYLITSFDGVEIELLFRALDRPDDIAKLLSSEYTGAWCNEVREIPWSIIEGIDGRIDRFPPPSEGGATWCGILMDTNPPDEDSVLHKKMETDVPRNPETGETTLEVFKQPSGLSPEAENLMTWPEWEQFRKDLDEKGWSNIVPGLKPDYYTNLAVGKSPDYVRVYIKGQYGFVKEGKPVYETTYNDELHRSAVTITPVQGCKLIIGMDFGRTPAAVICQFTPNGKFNVLREITSDGMGVELFIKNKLIPVLVNDFPEWYEENNIIVPGDPAGFAPGQNDEKTCEYYLKAAGFKAEPARANDLSSRITAVENLLSNLIQGQPGFQLDPSCKMLRKGFMSGYRYRKLKTIDEKYSDEPEKNDYSHPHDGLQYAALYVSEVRRKSRMPKRPRTSRYVAPSTGGY